MLVQGIVAWAILCGFQRDVRAEEPPDLRAEEPADIRIAYARVTDQRVAEHDAEGRVERDRSAFSVRLQVDGQVLAGVTSYGNIKYGEALDDLGNDLRPTSKYTLERNAEFNPINRIVFSMDMLEARAFEDAVIDRVNKEPRRGIRLDLDLRAPPRNATKVSVLKGEFQILKGGREREVVIIGLKTRAPKPIADPDLKAAGLAATILPPEDGDDGSTVRVQLTGPEHVIMRMKVINESGESLESEEDGFTSMPSRHGRIISFSLRQPLDDTARLTLRVLVGQEVVTIPFHVENIPLP